MDTRIVNIIGQGYVGLPLAQAAVQAGHTVFGYDTMQTKVRGIRDGRSPIEDVTNTDLLAMWETGRYHCYTDESALQGYPFDIAIVTVPTPLTDGQPDLDAVLNAAATVGRMIHTRPTGQTPDGQPVGGVPLVVLESTVAPGTTRHPFTDTIEQHSGGAVAGADFLVAFSPERIDPGNKQWTFRNTPKLVGGVTRAATRAATTFYKTICDTVHPVRGAEIAESAKLLENTFRHVNIALVNELARHLHAMGIDHRAVVEAAATKPYGFMPFHPGPGVGGHCLPIDPQYLAAAVEQRTGAGFDFIRLAMQVNRAQPAYVVQRATIELNDLGRAVNGSTILVVGAAYKRDSGDLRESPAEDIIRGLAELGATVYVYDPRADPGNLIGFAQFCCAGERGGEVLAVSEQHELSKLMEHPVSLFDLAMVVTDHTNVPYDDIVRTVPRVLDTRGTLPKAPNVVAL